MIEELKIKDAITRHNLTVSEVASRMGVNRFTLAHHMSGNPTVEILSRIAKAIGCDVVDLFTKKEIVCPKCGERIKT